MINLLLTERNQAAEGDGGYPMCDSQPPGFNNFYPQYHQEYDDNGSYGQPMPQQMPVYQPGYQMYAGADPYQHFGSPYGQVPYGYQTPPQGYPSQEYYQ